MGEGMEFSGRRNGKTRQRLPGTKKQVHAIPGDRKIESVCAIQSWLALGVIFSMLAWLIVRIKGMDDDEEEKKRRKYGTSALLGDLTTIPLAGGGGQLSGKPVHERSSVADSYARTRVNAWAIIRAGKKK